MGHWKISFSCKYALGLYRHEGDTLHPWRWVRDGCTYMVRTMIDPWNIESLRMLYWSVRISLNMLITFWDCVSFRNIFMYFKMIRRMWCHEYFYCAASWSCQFLNNFTRRSFLIELSGQRNCYNHLAPPSVYRQYSDCFWDLTQGGGDAALVFEE